MIDKKNYLKNIQYRNSNNLTARMNLHRYKTHPESLWAWVYRHYPIRTHQKILEIGCGHGQFWKDVIDQVPEFIQITLSDISEGMVRTVQESFRDDHRFDCQVADAEDLPFSSSLFDAVISHYMFYQLNSPESGIREVKRVLNHQGWFGLVMVAPGSGSQVFEMARKTNSQIDVGHTRDSMVFNSEHAFELLNHHFSRVERFNYINPLKITSAADVVDYVRSHPSIQRLGLEEELFVEYGKNVQNEINDRGYFLVNTSCVLFIAWK